MRKILCLLILLSAACSQGNRVGIVTPPERTVNYDPSTIDGGLAAIVGFTVYSPLGDKSWVKYGTGPSQWQPFPGSGAGGSGGSGGGVDPGTLVTLGSDAATWTPFTGLAGDTDGDYWFKFNLTLTGSGLAVFLRPNGSDPTTYDGSFLTQNVASGTITQHATRETVMVLSDVGVDGLLTVAGTLQSKSGRLRYLAVKSWRGSAANSDDIQNSEDGIWRDTGTVLSSLMVAATGSSPLIKAGSIAILGKLGRTP